MTTLELVLALGIPTVFISGVAGLGFRYIERRAQKRETLREKRDDEREEDRRNSLFMLYKGVDVAVSLSEATAHAVVEGKCNGAMSMALKKAEDFREDQKTAFMKQSSKQNL